MRAFVHDLQVIEIVRAERMAMIQSDKLAQRRLDRFAAKARYY